MYLQYVSAPKDIPARMVSQHACLDGLQALGELYDEDVDFYDNRGAGRREGQRGQRGERRRLGGAHQ